MRIKVIDNKVVNTYFGDDKKDGWIEVQSIPEPEEKEGYIPVLYYRDGKIVYEYEPLPEVPTEEVPQEDKIPMMRSATEEKVKALFFAKHISEDINSFKLPNNEALSVMDLYPEWKEGMDVNVGDRVRDGEYLWEALQAHKTQANWKPSLQTASIWKKVDEEHDGTQSDLIPYSPPMEIFKDKYYIQNGITYKCIRDSEIPLSHDLNALVGTYVELVK